MNENFKQEIIKNLENEAKELDFKIKKTREDENWGTYKNIIQAYANILELMDKYKSETKDKTELIDTIIQKYYNTNINLQNKNDITNKIQKYLGINYNINNVQLNPSHSWEFLSLLSEVILKLFLKEINNLLDKRGICKYFTNEDKTEFTIFNDNAYEVNNKDTQSIPIFQRIYKTTFTPVFSKTEVRINKDIVSLLNNDEELIMFLINIINGYIQFIGNNEFVKNKKSNEYIYIGIQHMPIFIYNCGDKELKIETEISIDVR